jgi:glutamine amidotransferase
MAKGTSKRVATVSRKTAETDISIALSIDGTGVSKIGTGVAFFDHMLTLFAKHGLFDLTVKAKGDVDVDYHHTVEDVGLVLGQAFKKALGDKLGIRRYGFFILPMDESLARVTVDVGGRPHLEYRVEAQSMFIRDFNLVLVKEFCRASTWSWSTARSRTTSRRRSSRVSAGRLTQRPRSSPGPQTSFPPPRARFSRTMMSAPIAVIDTGICNLRSVTKALEAAGALPLVVRSPAELEESRADGLVLPGVGALRDCVFSLRSSGLDASVREWIRADRPFLGVCLGMQALFDQSEEGAVKGLGIVPGRVVRFSLPHPFKIPHMGWNTIRFLQQGSPLQEGLADDGESFYFVHSFHCVPKERAIVLAECDYGAPFVAAIARGRLFATQFHPEKSQAKGLQIYRNFAASATAPLTRR